MKIGIIGLGYVGTAVADSYLGHRLLTNDPKHPKRSSSIKTLKQRCSAIFVCVPTPQGEDGHCDTSILESVIGSLRGYKGIVICKSTALPTVYKQLEKTSGLNLAHVPEFLTQARAGYDYLNPHKMVIGCKKRLRNSVTEVLMNSAINFDRLDIEYCSISEASFFKYMANTMLAMKVVINNEFYDLAETLGVDWEKISKIAKRDYRLGSTHWAVPGPDGSRGYGGACFPKDTKALQHLASAFSIDLAVLDAVIQKNYVYRSK